MDFVLQISHLCAKLDLVSFYMPLGRLGCGQPCGGGGDGRLRSRPTCRNNLSRLIPRFLTDMGFAVCGSRLSAMPLKAVMISYLPNYIPRLTHEMLFLNTLG